MATYASRLRGGGNTGKHDELRQLPVHAEDYSVGSGEHHRPSRVHRPPVDKRVFNATGKRLRDLPLTPDKLV